MFTDPAESQGCFENSQPGDQQLAARTGAAALDTTDMALGNPLLQCQLQLADAPGLAGPLEGLSERRR